MRRGRNDEAGDDAALSRHAEGRFTPDEEFAMPRILIALLLTSSAVVGATLFAGQGRTVAPVDPAAPEGRMDEPWWADRHRSIVAGLARNRDARVILIGDSITNNYDKAAPPDENFRPIWQDFYAPRGAINLGFSGDTAGNVLWRLQHGEVAGLRPKVAILLIGTNDTGWKRHSVADTRRAIDAVIADLGRRLPRTRILLLGLLPSDISAGKSAMDAAVNRHLAATYTGNPRVTYLDIDPIFRLPDGRLDTRLFYDPRLPGSPGALHPDTIGQRRMAEAIEPTLAKMLKEPMRVAPDRMTAAPRPAGAPHP